METIKKLIIEKNIKFNLLTVVNPETLPWIRIFVGMLNYVKNVELRHFDAIANYPHCCFFDSESYSEVLFFVTDRVNDRKYPQDAKVLWTNNRQLLAPCNSLWNEIWNQSIDIKSKIATYNERGKIKVQKKMS